MIFSNNYNLFWLLGLVFMDISCVDNDELHDRTSDMQADNYDVIYEHAKNNMNPYDFTGQIFYNTLVEFSAGNSVPDSIHLVHQEISEILNGLSTPVVPIYGSVMTIQNLLDDPVGVTDSLLINSNLSQTVRSDIKDYLKEVENYNLENFEEMLDYSITFEETALNDFTMTSKEKEVIFTLASIFRYYLYYSKGRDDQDWDVSVGNRAGLAGALHSTDSALAVGLIRGVCAQLGMTE